MARFKSTIIAKGREVSRLSDINATVKLDAWDTGVAVTAVSPGLFNIYVTGGSNSSIGARLIATIDAEDSGFVARDASGKITLRVRDGQVYGPIGE